MLNDKELLELVCVRASESKIFTRDLLEVIDLSAIPVGDLYPETAELADQADEALWTVKELAEMLNRVVYGQNFEAWADARSWLIEHGVNGPYDLQAKDVLL